VLEPSDVLGEPGHLKLGTPDHLSHRFHATLRSDISVSLAWGLRREEEEKPKPEWADQRCYQTAADVLWNGALALRYRGIFLIEGRTAVPAPRPEHAPSLYPDPPVGFYHVSQEQVTLWRLICVLSNPLKDDLKEYEESIRAAGFTIDEPAA